MHKKNGHLHDKQAKEIEPFRVHHTHMDEHAAKREKATDAYDKWHESVQADHEKREQMEEERQQRTPKEHFEFIKKQVESLSKEPHVLMPSIATSHFMSKATSDCDESHTDMTHETESTKDEQGDGPS